MKTLTLPGARPTFPEEDLPKILADIGDVLRGGRLILGPKTRELEATWAKRIGTKHAIALSSCTAALEIAYRHARVEGREVIIPTNTFVATANAAIAAGGKVIFSETSAADYGPDVDDILRRMGPATAAVVVVHIAGFVSADLPRLVEACRERGVALIEDCAHSHGATLAGRETGSFGNAGCFSFYPTKVLTCGVGGLLTTHDDSLAEFARSVRHHGQGASLEEIVHSGNDWMMDEVRAVLALAQVHRLDDFLSHRRRLAKHYDQLLAANTRIERPRVAVHSEPAFYKYPVLLPSGVDRDLVRRRLLEEHGIEMGAVYSPPCHLMPVFRNQLGTHVGLLPIAEAILPRQLALPMHVGVSEADAARSVAALDSVLRSLG